ncbi:HEPN AbiU2-like domain-containing protein [Shewanella loihica]|uniref:Uncharacterized protein n=1 Tax=Shewanella loihica (strain ATCC BAA-1088 / PV-4) TaxID=323850 RepID=A3QHH4_SHELP|nr:conserved hypothetical protein [Shewanella loihica PV-4]
MNFNDLHWKYYQSFEYDLNRLSRYIEINQDNFSTYSVELTRLYLSSCAEIDTVMKEICYQLSPNAKSDNIMDYMKVIESNLHAFITETAVIERFSISCTPWKAWQEQISPSWWKSHTDVKHNRNKHFTKANLKNVIDSICALYIANVYLRYAHLKSNDSGMVYSLSDAITSLPRDLDLIRIDCRFSYFSD